MHILDQSEAAIRAFLDRTGMTREELEQRREDDKDLGDLGPEVELDEEGQKKMGAHLEFEVVDEDEKP